MADLIVPHGGQNAAAISMISTQLAQNASNA